MDNDLIFGTETSDMLTGAGTDDVQIAAVPSTATPFDDALTRPFDAAQVVIPQGEDVVRVPVAPGEVVELPFPADAEFLARIDNGNLAIKVGDVTVILQGYVEAAGQTAPVIEAANGQPLDIATILASTDPNIDIQTAAGPAAGAQGQGADNTGGILTQFGEGAGLGGFTGAGALDATDGLGGGTVDQTGTLFVQFGLLDINLAPTADDSKRTVDEDHKILDGQVTATDPEGDALTYSLVSGPATGKLTFNADGTWTFDTDGKFESLNVGDHSPVTFTYKASDGVNESNVATVTIDVTGVNDAPKVTGGDSGLIIFENSPKKNETIQFTVTDVDDDPATAKYSIDAATLPAGVSFNSTTNKLTLDPNGHYDYLNKGESETYILTFVVTDAHGGTTTRDVSLEIQGVNNSTDAHNDHVFTNVDTGGGFLIPEWALLANDADRGTEDINGTGSDSGGTSSHSPGVGTNGQVGFTDDGTLSGSFKYQDTPDASIATVTVHNQAGGDLNGTTAGEILVGSGGGEKIDGKAGNDIIFGNGGADDIHGGSGDDTLIFAAGAQFHGDADTVTKDGGLTKAGTSEGDVLVLSADLKLGDPADAANLDGIETISMEQKYNGDPLGQSLTIGAGSVQQISDHTITPGGVFTSDKDAVRIDGDAVDHLYLSITKDAAPGGSWVDTGQVANGYQIYAHETVNGNAATTDAYVMVHAGVTVHVNTDQP